MSAHMKKHRTKLTVKDSCGRIYLIPKYIAEKYREPDDSISTEVFFTEYDSNHATSKSGMLLRGIRLRGGYTQEAFANFIDVSQANLSKMELGKRPIGKEMAKRIAKVFGINYQSLL